MAYNAVFGQKLACVVCDSRDGCDCWEKCSCGWFARKGFRCSNPETKKCSSKVNTKRVYTNDDYAKDTAHHRSNAAVSEE